MERRAVKIATVEGVRRSTQPNQHFVFCVRVVWSDGTVNMVYRRYKQFLFVRDILFQAFPEELGGPRSKRKFHALLPNSLSSHINIGGIIFKRLEHVDSFLKEILELEGKISQSIHVISFLTPTQEDLEPQRRVHHTKQTKHRNISKDMQRTLRKFGGPTKPRVINISSPVVFERYVVLEDYVKQTKQDINLKKGAIVDVIEKRRCGWWLVDVDVDWDGDLGWAPALHLEPKIKNGNTCSSAVVKFTIGKGEMYTTIKRYLATEDDELTFDIGVNLQVLEKNYDGWWKALYLGQEGWVPATYLNKLGDEHSEKARKVSRLCSGMKLRNEEDIGEEQMSPDELPGADLSTQTVTKSKGKGFFNLRRKLYSVSGHDESKKYSDQDLPDAEQGERSTNRTFKDSTTKKKKTIGSMIEMSRAFQVLDVAQEDPHGRPRPPSILGLQRGNVRDLTERKNIDSDFGSDLGLTQGNTPSMELGECRSSFNESAFETPPLETLSLDKDSPGYRVIQENHASQDSCTFIQQEPPENETSQKLDDKMSFSSSSNESDLEFAEKGFQKVLVHNTTIGSAGNVTMELEQCSIKEDVSPDTVACSTESLGLFTGRSNFSEGDIYCTISSCEVDGEDLLSEDEYVHVLKKCANDWWLVQHEDGSNGWAPSNFLYPAPLSREGVSCLLPDSEEAHATECSLQMPCRATGEYSGDPECKEVSLREGETVHVLYKSDNGWWCVRNEDGQTGWAPSNYLEGLDDDHDSVLTWKI